MLSTIFSKLEYFDRIELLKHTWSSASKVMTEAEFKREMQCVVSALDMYLPKKMLIDQRQFYFVVLPSLHRWVDKTVHKKLLDIGCKKIACLVPPGILSKLSISELISPDFDGFE